MKRLDLPNGWRFLDVDLQDDREVEFPGPIARIGHGRILDWPNDPIEMAEEACRRIDVLAGELGCLGFFSDGGDDGPKAA